MRSVALASLLCLLGGGISAQPLSFAPAKMVIETEMSAIKSVSVEITKGYVHFHTTFSDGALSISEAVEYCHANGVQYLIVTEHAETFNETVVTLDIFGKTFAPRLVMPKKAVGVDEWLRQVDEQRHGFPVEPGLEVSLGPQKRSHLLFFGGRYDDLARIYARVIQIATTMAVNDPNEALNQLSILARATGSVMIEAHPNHQKYSFDYELPANMGHYGVEVFNDSISRHNDDIRRIGEVQARSNYPVAVTAGVDFHVDDVTATNQLLGMNFPVGKGTLLSLNPLEYSPQKLRFTYICGAVGNPDVAACMVRDAHVYAAYNGLKVGSITTLFGYAHDPNEHERFGITLEGGGLNTARNAPLEVLAVCKGSKRFVEAEVPMSVTGLGAQLSKSASFSLREVLKPEQENSGWWMFLATPDFVGSAIDISPFRLAAPVVVAPKSPPSVQPVRPPSVVQVPQGSKQAPIPSRFMSNSELLNTGKFVSGKMDLKSQLVAHLLLECDNRVVFNGDVNLSYTPELKLARETIREARVGDISGLSVSFETSRGLVEMRDARLYYAPDISWVQWWNAAIVFNKVWIGGERQVDDWIYGLNRY